MRSTRGSLWSKWDLHVHTPLSVVQHYGGDTDEVWGRFIDDLESLPADFTVLGINDYIFLDGYRRLRHEKDSNGRLANISLLIPVIELRIDKFAGTDGQLRRLNYHIIFSNELPIETIEHQFLNGLSTSYHLSPHQPDVSHSWSSIVTRESLAKLGEIIINAAPEERRHQFGPALREGFNNVNFKLENIQKLLDNPIFSGKFLTAVGKAEWDQVRWNDNSVAEKRTIINRADVVFTAAESPARWRAAKDALAAAQVNSRLLDCSDAHALSDSKDKDRVGNCFTWIKSDTSFNGLRQALNEPDERICVDVEPAQLRRVRESRTKYIRSIEVRKRPESALQEEWFDFTLDLNHGLVAIIGNRGMGKSALTDILALLGVSRSSKFSFLDERHFRDPKSNKAKHFVGTITWESDATVSRGLHDDAAEGTAALVRYVPQNFFEELCNELPESKKKGALGQELRDVIFSHVKDDERRGCANLDALINLLTEAVERELVDLRARLKSLNHEVVRLQEALSPEARLRLEKDLEVKAQELKVHDASQPGIKIQPQKDQELERQIEAVRNALAQVDLKIKGVQGELGQAKQKQTALQNIDSRVDGLVRHVETSTLELAQDLAPFGIDVESVLEFRVHREGLELQGGGLTRQIANLEEQLAAGTGVSLTDQRVRLAEQLQEFQAQLDGPALEYQHYLDEVAAWKRKREAIVGAAETPETIAFLESQLGRLDVDVANALAEAEAKRVVLVREIFERLEGLAAKYRKLYESVQQFLDKHPWVREELKLGFGVALEVSRFPDRFLALINQKRRGAFQGREEGGREIRSILREVDFNSVEEVVQFVARVDKLLHEGPGGITAQLLDQDLANFYDFLYSLEYLVPSYTLNVGGRGLETLSPGERGMLLLVFYLLVDQGDVPLIIDQPEENLDNQSVYRLLVPCIREVRKRRQIILVTHNPNLAVVCDAEQIIHATIDKEHGFAVTYTCGPIEDAEINQKILDVLEGTKPAFDNRARKYQLFSLPEVVLPSSKMRFTF